MAVACQKREKESSSIALRGGLSVHQACERLFASVGMLWYHTYQRKISDGGMVWYGTIPYDQQVEHRAYIFGAIKKDGGQKPVSQ